ADEAGPSAVEVIEQEFEPLWIACTLRPLEGLFGCLSRARPIALQDIVACPPPDLGALDPAALPERPDPCRVTDGSPARPELTIPVDPQFLFGGDIEVTMVGHLPGDGSTAACASSILE